MNFWQAVVFIRNWTLLKSIFLNKFLKNEELHSLKKFHLETQPHSDSECIAGKLGDGKGVLTALSCECSCSLAFSRAHKTPWSKVLVIDSLTYYIFPNFIPQNMSINLLYQFCTDFLIYLDWNTAMDISLLRWNSETKQNKTKSLPSLFLLSLVVI